MAVLLLECVPDYLDVEQDADGFVITVPAIDLEDGAKFAALECRLSPMPSYPPETYEFSFHFAVSDLDGSDLSYSTQDRYEVARIFGDLSREWVLPTVCACVEELVDAIQPTYIFRVTKGRSLPQEAMRKHLLVTDTLLGLGYSEVQSGTDDLNRTFWFMGR